MRITGIDIHPLRIPLKGVFRNAHDTKTRQDSIVVRVRTDEGISGLGNVDPDPGHSAESFSETLKAVRTLAPGFAGRDPLNLSAGLELMDRCLPRHLDAKAALEMASLRPQGQGIEPAGSLAAGRAAERRGAAQRLDRYAGSGRGGAGGRGLARCRLQLGEDQAGRRGGVRSGPGGRGARRGSGPVWTFGWMPTRVTRWTRRSVWAGLWPRWMWHCSSSRYPGPTTPVWRECGAASTSR